MPSRLAHLAPIAIIACLLYVTFTNAEKADINVGSLSTQEIEEQLQKCPILQSLTDHHTATNPPTQSLLQQSFALLFPFSSPALNSLMGTLYISGPPNFLLALCPTDIDPSSLNVMVAFAVGGLLGDTLFHLLPEIFLGEVPEGGVKAVLVEPNKNLLLGVAILVGFVTFVAMDKGLRIATGGEGHTHDHGKKEEPNGGLLAADKATTTATSPSSGSARERKPAAAKNKPLPPTPPTKDATKPPIKLSAYLNIIADFTHNITDGLALSSSFYASPALGATTTLAVFCHEIPHEVGDFALLIQGGMSKKLAMGLQFVTALGAVLGTIIGITIQEFGGSGADAVVAGMGNQGLAGTSLSWGDMLLPFTAGTFLYVGTVGVIPEMLETGPDKLKELRGIAVQFLALAAGAGLMLGISWS